MTSRRTLLKALAGSGFAALRPVRAAGFARVLVVGGGFAGASCARTLKRLQPRLDVCLIERRAHFYTGPFSNAVIAGIEAAASIERSASALQHDGVRVLTDTVVELDPVARRVRTAAGRQLTAEAIVVAPGIALDEDAIEGLPGHADAAPSAWTGDADVLALRAQVAAARDGAVIAIAAPPNPYRCPPGPYERASLIAHALRGRRAKVLVCDAKDDFTKRALFQLEWDRLYPGTIEWLPRMDGGEVVSLDARARTLQLAGGERLRFDVASIIPPQRAGELAHRADLIDASGWCPVRAHDFRSTRHAGIHVIGDAAAAAPMPKSAYAANSQAKLAALAIVRELQGQSPQADKLLNTCYSLTTPDRAISVSAVYGNAHGTLSTLSSGESRLGADDAERRREAAYARAWYANITRDSFGAPPAEAVRPVRPRTDPAPASARSPAGG